MVGSAPSLVQKRMGINEEHWEAHFLRWSVGRAFERAGACACRTHHVTALNF